MARRNQPPSQVSETGGAGKGSKRNAPRATGQTSGTGSRSGGGQGSKAKAVDE
jgi:hypothetical protein